MDGLRAGMTDAEILAYYRRRCPYISLGSAKGVYRTWAKFRHLGAIARRRRARLLRRSVAVCVRSCSQRDNDSAAYRHSYGTSNFAFKQSSRVHSEEVGDPLQRLQSQVSLSAFN
jgi:hypothetical protein